jgi:hypothetical protein
MKVNLLFPEGCPKPEGIPAFARDALKKDLELDTILNAVAGKDDFILESLTEAVFTPLSDPELIAYRHETLRDAAEYREEVRAIYELCRGTDRRRLGTMGTLNWMTNYDLNATYNGAVNSLSVQTETLQKLRKLAESYEDRFRSRAFRGLFRMLQEELTDSYLEEVKRQLAELSYPGSFLVSARLGSYLQGVDYVLLRRSKKLALELAVTPFYRPDEKDESGKDSAARQARAVNGVTNALAQAAVYLYDFFDRLRSELAFYIGCLILMEGMQSKQMPMCYPTMKDPDPPVREWKGLYDISLVVVKRAAVTGNDLRADGKCIYLVTGANQGGKSTFLRSLGQAQLMAQCGMPVGAERFAAPLRKKVYSHFKREEDRWMRSGKLDEELERMRKITDYIRPGDLLLLNESFSSTSEREGSEMLRQVTQALADSGVEIFSVTHLHTYATAFRDREEVQFLRAERRSDGERTFRIVSGSPLETAYGEDLYREVFG